MTNRTVKQATSERTAHTGEPYAEALRQVSQPGPPALRLGVYLDGLGTEVLWGPFTGHPAKMLVVEGPAGSGKTVLAATLARQVANRLPVTVVTENPDNYPSTAVCFPGAALGDAATPDPIPGPALVVVDTADPLGPVYADRVARLARSTGHAVVWVNDQAPPAAFWGGPYVQVRMGGPGEAGIVHCEPGYRPSWFVVDEPFLARSSK